MRQVLASRISMLFHVTHVHTVETCPSNDPERIKATFGKMLENADELGVKIHSMYSNNIAHKMYMVVETDSAESISKMMDPTLKIATAEVSPIVDAHAVMSRLIAAPSE
jgi:hypothetical protein